MRVAGEHSEAGELKQALQDMDKYTKALQQELAITKAELAKWRGFTDDGPVLGPGARLADRLRRVQQLCFLVPTPGAWAARCMGQVLRPGAREAFCPTPPSVAAP